METCTSVYSCGSSGCSLKFRYRCTFTNRFYQILCCHFCTCYVIRCNLAVYINTIHNTVYRNNLDTFRNRILYCRSDCIRVYRIYDQNRYISGNQVFYVIGLFRSIITCINRDQFRTFFFCFCLCTLCEAYKKRVI